MIADDQRGVEEKYRECGMAFRCNYCGQPADTTDHTVPRSHVREHRRAYATNWFPKVAACLECNVMLGTEIMPTFTDRKRHVGKKLRLKYRKHLRAAGWADDELKALGYSLRVTVRGKAKIAEKVYTRILFADQPGTRGVPEDLFGQRVEPMQEAAE